MQTTERQREAQHESKTKLDAALRVIRAKGYGATRIDDVCEAAGLTKGSFFHHFNSKEELALEAAEYSSLLAEKVFFNGALSEPAPTRLSGWLGTSNSARRFCKATSWITACWVPWCRRLARRIPRSGRPATGTFALMQLRWCRILRRRYANTASSLRGRQRALPTIYRP